MQDGCKLADTLGGISKCSKYGCLCCGLIKEKYKCPVWAEAITIESYYWDKNNLDRVLAGI